MRACRAAASAMLLGVAALTACSPSSSTAISGLGLSQPTPVTQAQARDFIATAQSSLNSGGYALRFQFGDPASGVTITRLPDRVQFPLDGFRMGTAGQLAIGDPHNPWMVTAYDDGRRTLCRSGQCVSFTDQSTGKVPAAENRLVDAANVLAQELPVSPHTTQEAVSSLDGLPPTTTLWTGRRTTAVGDAQCLAADDPRDGAVTLLCVLKGGAHPGVVVDTGAQDEGVLNHTLVDVLGP